MKTRRVGTVCTGEWIWAWEGGREGGRKGGREERREEGREGRRLRRFGLRGVERLPFGLGTFKKKRGKWKNEYKWGGEQGGCRHVDFKKVSCCMSLRP